MSAENGSTKRSWLPEQGTWKYHLLLGATALLVLGPLGGVTAAYMNFSLGFFIGGQVLAGILGSAVTFGYGADGKHGANYIQTMSASVPSTTWNATRSRSTRSFTPFWSKGVTNATPEPSNRGSARPEVCPVACPVVCPDSR